MRALSLTQPWATLVAIGAKKIETRSWKTSYRGPIAIHAAKGFPRLSRRYCEQAFMQQALGWPRILNSKSNELQALMDSLPKGFVIAIADLLDCRKVVEDYTDWHATMGGYTKAPLEPEVNFGDYEPGRFAWQLGNVSVFPDPIAAKGALSLWNWTR